VISGGGVNSGVFRMISSAAIKGDFTGLKFTIANGQKDLRYYTHMTELLPTSSLMGEAVHQSLVQATLLGFGDKFIGSLIEAQERLNGFQIVKR
jgi:3-hydroxyisobutyrate dehydrogenase-like beta-hydroxyacid dehydrogenase